MTSACLKWIDERGDKKVFLLTANEVLIGRKSDADIVVPSASVSRRHAKLTRGSDGYSILDMPNTHGTYVNGRKIREHRLVHGDVIRIGRDGPELRFTTRIDGVEGPIARSASVALSQSWVDLTSIVPITSTDDSDLEKLSALLDFQHEWGRTFSAERTLEQILAAALKISRAERGYILLKRQDGFEYAAGLAEDGERLLESAFRASQSVARQVANEGEPVYAETGIQGDLAEQQSIVNLHLRSLACIPLRWLSPEADVPTVNGVLYLDSTNVMRSFSKLDQKIFQKLALEAAKVFETLELIKAMEQQKSLQLELDRAQQELRVADALRRAEGTLLLAEYGESIGRFAAAMSHELNSPVGALKSTFQTLDVLARKKSSVSLDKRAEMEVMEAGLRRTANESLECLHQVVLRMQRFTNLDRSALLPVDVNSLLHDVIEIVKAGASSQVTIESDFEPLPSIPMRPQQMSAVFSNLLRNAIEGTCGEGRVRIATRQATSQVEISLEDDGKGIPAEELATIFDPVFRVREGRVSTGNWSLFSSRQILREHGGEIEIRSTFGKGTSVRVRLPYTGEVRA